MCSKRMFCSVIGVSCFLALVQSLGGCSVIAPVDRSLIPKTTGSGTGGAETTVTSASSGGGQGGAQTCGANQDCPGGQLCVDSVCTSTGTGGQGGSTSGTGGQGGTGGGCGVNEKYCGNPAMCTAQTVDNGCSSPACDASCFHANNSDVNTCGGPGGACLVICEQAKQDTAGHLDCDGDANNPAGNGCEFDLHNASRCTCPGDGNPDCPQGKKCGTVQVNGVWMPTCL